MFGLFKSKPAVIATEYVAIQKMVEELPKPKISEPVVSIIAEMKNLDNWRMEEPISRWTNIIHLTHGKKISFMECFGETKCQLDWLTSAEQTAMVAAFYEMKHGLKLRKQAIERQSFMVFVDNRS